MTKQIIVFSAVIFLLFSVIEISPTLLCAAESEGLVLYYTFDTESKDVITDLSGNGNDAAIKGQVKWDEGKLGKALLFEANGQYLEVPDSESLKPEEAMTIALWMSWKGEMLPNTAIEKFVYQDGGWIFKMENSETNLWLYDKASGAHMYRAVPMPTKNEWTHLAVTFDSKNQRGYVNGVKAEKSGNVDMPWAGPLRHVNSPLKIGAYSASFLFTGMLDDIAIYNRALSEEEVLDVMKNGHAKGFMVDHLDKLAGTWGNIKLFK